MPNKLPGFFIVLEGIDGSGTTSQANLLALRIRQKGLRVLKTFQPSTGEIGKMIRSRIKADGDPLPSASLALLFAADRIDHFAKEIEPALRAGHIVICDRYIGSSWVYQSLFSDPGWVMAINKKAQWPDLTLVLDLPVVVAQERLRKRAQQEGTPLDIFDDAETQERVARGYREFGESDHPNTYMIDGERRPERVADDIEEAVIRGLRAQN